MTSDPLIIGIGNPDRGDDAAGILVTRALTGHRTKELPDCTTLIDVWEGERNVVVVDAMRSGRRPGTVGRFDAGETQLPAKSFSSTHSFGLAEAVELGRILNRLPDSLVIYGIELGHVAAGFDVSTTVERAVASIVTILEEGEV